MQVVKWCKSNRVIVTHLSGLVTTSKPSLNVGKKLPINGLGQMSGERIS